MLAGTWRFLTYFGRDTMIAMLLMKDRLSNEALEAGIGAVLERENATGVICHEETIGDYATLTNLLNNITSTAPSYSYIMIDSDLYLQPLLVEYFLNTPGALNRTIPFLRYLKYLSQLTISTIASVNPANAGVSYAELAFRNAFHVMSIAAPFAAEGNQTEDNLIHLREGQIVGQWRDSTYGIGGAMIPYDVNTALVPASLRAIAQLTDAGFYPSYSNWSALATQYAQVWEDETLHFFEVTVPQAEAQQLVETYVQESNFTGPAGNVTEDILFYGLGLNGYNNQSTVLVMNSDDCLVPGILCLIIRFPSFPFDEYYKSNSIDDLREPNRKSSQCWIPSWFNDGCEHASCKPGIRHYSKLCCQLDYRSLPRHSRLGMAIGI
jgi:hypothetical protein